MMAFFGLEVCAKQVAPEEPLTSVLFITQACLAKPLEKGTAVLKLVNLTTKESFTLCVLNETRPQHTLSLYVDPQEVKFQVEGGAKVHLTGYYEHDEEGIMDTDSEEEEVEENAIQAIEKKSNLVPVTVEGEEEEESDEEEDSSEKSAEESKTEAAKAEKKVETPKVESEKLEEVESDLEQPDWKKIQSMADGEEEEEEEESDMSLEEMIAMIAEAKKRGIELPPDVKKYAEMVLEEAAEDGLEEEESSDEEEVQEPPAKKVKFADQKAAVSKSILKKK